MTRRAERKERSLVRSVQRIQILFGTRIDIFGIKEEAGRRDGRIKRKRERE
jgi:hypothetical protein